MKKKNLSVKKIVPNSIFYYLSDKKILKIYKIFKNNINFSYDNKIVAGAISGGSDSLALAFFLKCLSIEKKINVVIYHVDHKLRKNSKNEATSLKKILSKLDMKVFILNWKGKKPLKNIQAKARNIRYKLIYNRSIKDHINSIFFAHNQDDIIENFFMRIMRGSGLEGFVSFNSNFYQYSKNLNILRPLISIKKEDLEYVTKKVFNCYIKDPSNTDESFKRVRIRNILKNLKTEGFNLDKIFLTINNLTNTNKAIRYYSEENINSNLERISKEMYIANHNFFNKPHEIVLRSLSTIIKKIGMNYYPPRGKQLANLTTFIKTAKFHKSTLSNCVIEKFNNSIVFYPETRKKRLKKV